MSNQHRHPRGARIAGAPLGGKFARAPHTPPTLEEIESPFRFATELGAGDRVDVREFVGTLEGLPESGFAEVISCDRQDDGSLVLTFEELPDRAVTIPADAIIRTPNHAWCTATELRPMDRITTFMQGAQDQATVKSPATPSPSEPGVYELITTSGTILLREGDRVMVLNRR